MRKALVAAALLAAMGRAAATDVIGWLRDHPSAARATFLKLRPCAVHGRTRTAAMTNIPSTFEVPLTVPPGGRLRLGIAVDSRFLGVDVTRRARPTRFTGTLVFAGPDGGEVELFARTLDIRARPADRRWVDLDVDLAAWAGRSGTLRLTVALDGHPHRHGKTLAAWSRPLAYDARAQGERPNLLFVTVDALRADHLGAWGYRRDTSPRLDRLASEGVRFADAFTNAPMTQPSIAQLFTSSVFPTDDSPNLLTVLAGGGVPRTRAFLNNPYIDYWLTLQSPDTFDGLTAADWRADRITRAALDWTRTRKDRRFALYLHYLDTHTPYRTPPPQGTAFTDPAYAGPVRLPWGDVEGARAGRLSAADRTQVVALYDGAIRFVDTEIGRLLDGLAAEGLLEKTLVVVTADHGEELWDHDGFFHGQSLYDELLHVPLILRLPGAAHAGTVVREPVRAIDVVPTIAAALDLPSSPTFEGRSLLPLLDAGAAPSPAPPLFARAANARFPYRFALRTPTHKLVLTVDPAREELYDLAADPRERADLAADPAAAPVLARMREALAVFRAPLAGRGFQVRAVGRTDGPPARVQVTVRTDAGRQLANPDRVGGAPTGGHLRLDADGRTLVWEAEVGPTPLGFRFDEGLVGFGAAATLEIAVVVDGADAAPSMVRLGAAGAPAPAARFVHRRGAAGLTQAGAEEPLLAAATSPALVPPDAEAARVYLWRLPDAPPVAAGPGLDAASRERLRALGYVE